MSQKTRSSGGNRAETVVVPLDPHQELADVKQIGKDPRHAKEIIRGEAEKGVPDRDRRRSRRRQEQQGLDPIQATLKERTGEKKMLGRFQMVTTKTRRWQLIAERNEALRSIEYPMRHLPVQIPDLSVQRHKA